MAAAYAVGFVNFVAYFSLWQPIQTFSMLQKKLK